jgi:hypothetical protein
MTVIYTPPSNTVEIRYSHSLLILECPAQHQSRERQELQEKIIDIWKSLTSTEKQLNQYSDDTDIQYEPVSIDSRKGLFGIWKGKVWMADDFDAPLEDLAEYM